MQIKPVQLEQYITNETPFYLLTGDETMMRMEAEQQLREQLEAQGVNERQTFVVDGTGFNWQVVMAEIAAPSLFAEKRLIELKTNANKLNAQAAAALKNYLDNPPLDVVLVLSAPKLEKSEEKKAWYKAGLESGVIVNFWPLSHQELPRYIQRRLQQMQLNVTLEAVQFLTQQFEGNLLALKQELEKLKLLFDEQTIDEKEVMQSVVGASKYSIFDLGEAVLLGHSQKVIKILRVLEGEGAEPVLLTWSITRELKLMAELARGNRDVLRNYRIPQHKQRAYHDAVGRYRPRAWLRLYAASTRLDKIAKGLERVHFWNALENICLGVCGRFATRP